MTRPPRRTGLKGLQKAYDEIRFGDRRTLNLRESLPYGAGSCDAHGGVASPAAGRPKRRVLDHHRPWQSERGRCLGRARSRDSPSARPQAARRCRRPPGTHAGLDGRDARSNLGTLGITEAQWRTRCRHTHAMRTPPSLRRSRSRAARIMLRNLAERALEGLGVKDTAKFLQAEMLKQFGALAATVGDAPGREARLRTALRAALDQHE